MSLMRNVERWLTKQLAKPATRIGHNEWIEGTEGAIYIRYNAHLDRIDLANWSIDDQYQRQGLSKRIIKLACGLPVRTIRIENILNMV